MAQGKKQHLIQRWYEQTERERIVSSVGIWIIAIIMALTAGFLYNSQVELACSTGDIDLDLSINSSNDLQNLSIYGVDNMRCTFKGPAFALAYLN